jgi:hypothetical protein
MTATPNHQKLVVLKSCDRCGCETAAVMLPRSRAANDVRTDDAVRCDDCGMSGSVVLHGATPSSDGIEDTFDVAWIDPDTGEDFVF